MKNPLKTAIRKVKNDVGGSSSRLSCHSDDYSQGGRRGGSARFSWEDTPSEEHAQEEQHHGTIVALRMRAMDPESGLLFNQQKYQRYLSI